MKKKGDLSACQRGMALFQKPLPYLDFNTTTSRIYRERFKKRDYPVSSSALGENALLMAEVRRISTLLWADRQEAVTTVITAYYNQRMQKSIIEFTEEDGPQQERSHWMRLLLHEQVIETALHRCSPYLDYEILRKCCLDGKQHKIWIHPALYQWFWML